MIVGLWGVIAMFQVSEKKIYTWRDLTVETEGRWAEHEIITELPRAEYLGPGVSKFTMTVDLIAELGVKPRIIADRLREHCKLGTTAPLIVGTKRLTDNDVRLDAISQEWKRILKGGELAKCTMDLTFVESL